MPATISSMIAREGEKILYDAALRQVFEDHLDHFIHHEETERLDIEDHQAYKHEGDLYGLLETVSVPRDMFWLTMRMNGMTSPTEYDGSPGQLIIPPRAATRNVIQLYRSAGKR